MKSIAKEYRDNLTVREPGAQLHWSEAAEAEDQSWFSSFEDGGGESVVRITWGFASECGCGFWKALVLAVGRWDPLLRRQLEGGEIPRTAGELERFLELLRQARSRSGRAILVFQCPHLLGNCPAGRLVSAALDLRTEGIAVVFLAGDRVEVGLESGVPDTRAAGGAVRLSREELRVYFMALGIVCSREILERIWPLTEGWVSVIRLLGRHMCKGEKLTPTALGSGILLAHEELHREYLAPLDSRVRQSLILLSLLRDFPLELAVDLTALEAEDLQRLQEDNPFLLYRARDNSYCFHRFYRDFLRDKQIEVSKKIRYAFLRKAAHWWEERGALEEPLQYYADCQDYERMLQALHRIITHSMRNLSPERAAFVVGVLERVPGDFLDAHPRHRLYLILALHLAGRWEDAQRMQKDLHKKLEAGGGGPEGGRVLGELELVEAFQAWCGDPAGYLGHLARAAELLPEGTEILDEGESFASSRRSALSFRHMIPGALLGMKQAALEGIPLTRRPMPRSGAALSYLAAAEAHMYRMELEESRLYAGKAIEEAVTYRQWGSACDANYLLLRISMAQGSLDKMTHHHSQIRIYRERLEAKGTAPLPDIAGFHLHMYLGLYHKLAGWVAEEAPAQSEAGRELYANALFIALPEGQYYPALTYIDNAIPLCRLYGMWFCLLKLLLLRALVFLILGKPDAAAKQLAEAYRMSWENEIILPFAELGRMMVGLLDTVRPQAVADGVSPHWLDRVAKEAREYQARKDAVAIEYRERYPREGFHRLGVLSKAEYRALRSVCEGRTTQETADLMMVLPATVNTYLYRAFRKLGVSGRAEAVRIALAEGIMEAR